MPNKSEEAIMPDLGTGMLVSILKNEGFYVSQVDLKPVQREQHPLHNDYHNISPLEAKYFLEHSKSEKISSITKKIVSKFKLDKYDMLGFSLDEGTIIGVNLAIIKEIKNQIDCCVILGGTFDFSKRHIKKFQFIDFIIKGDATYSLSKLLEEMEKPNPNLNKVPGLIYRENKEIKSNKYFRQMGNTELVPDFSDLNMEDYKLTPKEVMGDYYHLIKEQLPQKKTAILPFHFIKGCPNSCNFCFWNREKYFKCTKPEEVSNLLIHMKKRYKINNFFFLNNSFNPTVKYGEKLVNSFISNDVGINWSDSINPRNTHQKMIEKAGQSGCRLLYWGIESASKRVLKLLNKNNPEKSSLFENYLKKAHESNIFNGINFFLGIPYEKKEDILKTKEFIKRTHKYFEFYNANLLWLFPEFPLINNPSAHNIRLRKIGSIEQRNPSENHYIKKTLDEVGINKKIKFYSFDELEGLNWEKKNKQDINHCNIILNTLDKKKKEFFDNIHRTFYLSTVFQDKKEILNLFENIKKK